MEIFNVSIPELLLIAGLALVVFGPERLPEIGRFLGKQVAKLLAWQQNSPEMQMLNEVRSEFEGEIASLRDELVRTRKQLDVSRDITSLKEELRPMLDLRGGINGMTQAASPRPAEPTATSPSPSESQSPPAPASSPAPPASPSQPLEIKPTPAGQTIPASIRPTKIVAAEPTNVLAPPRPPANPDSAQLDQRLQQLSADVQALIAELQARGQLDPAWQSPREQPEQETVIP